ncbi:MAG: Rpn family recombination-promoting nuclease/putative transposase [Defluviitaleaceae bacterium]|nr:Rpn family recombination-promoting nuclease/putative transposase [Defluviitaleaceae bacterium]
MKKLEHTLTNDILAKLLFTKYPDLLKLLVAELLGVQYDNIIDFQITNPEMPPETIGDKFCKLDINMIVNSQQVSLEIQVANEGNYKSRSQYYWSKMNSLALKEGMDYNDIPNVISINILDFNEFADLNKFNHEFQFRETETHEPLTGKDFIRFYELRKLPPLKDTDSGKELWLKLFKAKTEEDLEKISELGVPIMSQAIAAYRHVAATDEFKELERMRHKARHDEVSALNYAKNQGAEEERQKWQGVVDEQAAQIAELEAQLSRK